MELELYSKFHYQVKEVIKIKNRYLIYFIIAGLLLGSFLGSLRANALSFGGSGIGSTTSIENVCVGGYYRMGNHDGIANNITIYISSGLSYSGYAKCKIYYGSNGTALLNGETLSTQITLNTYAYYVFYFINPKPILNANTYYYLTILAQSGIGNCLLVYSNTGGSTTTSKVATYDTFPVSWTSYTNIDTSSTPSIYCNYDNIITNSPTSFNSVNKSGTDNIITLTWDKDVYASYTRIMYKKTYFPSTINDGTLAYNGTGTSYDLSGLNKNTIYFFSAWCYDATIAQWSITYSITCNRTVTISFCCSTALTVYNNTVHTTGKYETSYNSTTGNKIWLNFTGEIPTITKYYNLKNTTGTMQSQFLTSGWNYKVWANYTGYSLILTILENLKNCTGAEQYYYNNITGWKVYNNFTGFSILLNAIENLINCTGTLEYKYNNITGFKVWANYTGNTTGCPSCNSTDLILYENIINATGIHQSLYNPVTGWKVWANYTGNVSLGNCSGIYWYNYTDDNLTLNISFNKASSLYTSNGYKINENNWLYLATALLLDNSQFFLLIVLSLWLFFVGKYLEYKDITVALMQFGLSIPLCIIVAVISLSFAFGYIIVFLIPIISLILLADGFFYSKKKR